MTEKIKGLKTSSLIIAVISKICYVASIVAMCLCAATVIFVLATGGETSIITTGNIRIMVADDMAATPEALIAICGELLVFFAFLFVIGFLTYGIFNGIYKSGQLFNQGYVKTIKTIAVLIVAMTIVMGIVELFAGPYTGVEILDEYSELPGFGTGVILFCLAYIFDYGCAVKGDEEKAIH